MVVIECLTQQERAAFVTAVESIDFDKITRRRYFFDWKEISDTCRLYKLVLAETNEILGLMALVDYPEERRVEVQLLAVSKENKGREKHYEGIAGCLLGYACREAFRQFGEMAAVSLMPKTVLRKHYIEKYGMEEAGRQLYVEKSTLRNLLLKYDT